MAAQEQEDIGEVAIEESDIVSDWAKPSHDLGARSVGVFDGETLVAYAELMGADRADTSVLPSHRGRGIGTWLAHWLQDLGRRVGSSVVGMPVPQGSPGDRLLEELGFRVRWTSWVLELPAGATIPERELPEGYVVRTAEPGELRAAHDVLEDAFLEWSVRERESFEDFEASTTGRPGFEPWNLRVVLDPDAVGRGRLAGAGLRHRLDRVRRPARRTSRPAQPRTGAGAPRGFLRPGTGPRDLDLGAEHGLAHRCARPLRTGRNGRREHLGQSRDRPVVDRGKRTLFDSWQKFPSNQLV